MNNQDCGCDGNSTNMDILNRNLGVNNNIPPSNVVNHNSTQYVNNMRQNQQQINNNSNLNNMIAPNNHQNEINQLNEVNKKVDSEKFCRKEVRIFLYILLALSLNEMCKFFINQSIRLNKASSNRYLYYPLGILVILVLVCLF